LTKGRKKTGVVRQIIVAVVVALLVGGTVPWWWNNFFGDNGPNGPPPVNENDANKLFSKYLKYAQEEDYEKIRNLYFDFDNCGSCQQDLKNLKLFKGKNIKVKKKEFLTQKKALKVKMEFETGRYYEPTFYLLKTKWIPVCNRYKTKVKEVLP